MEGMKGWAWLLAAAAMACVPSAHAQQVSFQTLPVMQISTPIPGSTHAPQDLNGDGLSDMLWFNPTSSTLQYWLTQDSGGSVLIPTKKSYAITPGYFVGAVGDTNGDGYADLVWTSAKHDLYFWVNAKNGGFRSVYYGTYPSGWQLFGAGDVNGDGRDDLLWLNPGTCQFAYWLMDGTRRVSYRIIPYTCGYYPIAIGYFTPSNRISILWSSSHQDLWLWDSKGAGFTSASIGSIPQPFTSLSKIISVGGGQQGQGMVLDVTDDSGTQESAYSISRTFGTSGLQTGYSISNFRSGGATSGSAAAGFLVEAGSTNNASVIPMNKTNEWFEFCDPSLGATQFSCHGTLYQLIWLLPTPNDWWPVGGAINEVPPLVSP